MCVCVWPEAGWKVEEKINNNSQYKNVSFPCEEQCSTCTYTGNKVERSVHVLHTIILIVCFSIRTVSNSMHESVQVCGVG